MMTYIAHLSKQLCILTVEVSAKFTALRFLYKFYSPDPRFSVRMILVTFNLQIT